MESKKLLLLADVGSPHTQRWANTLAKRGFQVMVVGLNPINQNGYQGIVQIEHLGIPRVKTQGGKDVLKLVQYLKVIPQLRSLLRSFRPDIVHAHYATSYGLLGVLCHHHPFIISVWGSDIFNFPKHSWFHKWLLIYNLKMADTIASTSHVMARETALYTNKSIHVTPFGVDTALFKPQPNPNTSRDGHLTIGIVKTLEPKYGISTLVRAFLLLAPRYSGLNLLIVGDGSQSANLHEMVAQADLTQRVRFVGAVPHAQVPDFLNQIDVFVVPSVEESFGVAAVEASACGLPVVASRIGGLPEVVVDGTTGFLFPPGDTDALVQILSSLIESPELRYRLGQAGRAFVEQQYSWEESVDKMVQIYARH